MLEGVTMPFHPSGHKPQHSKHFQFRQYIPASIIGVTLVLIAVLITVYKKSIPLTVSALLTPALGGSYCGELVRLKGKVLLSNQKPSGYLLEDLKDSVTVEIVSAKGIPPPDPGQLVEVRGAAICIAFPFPYPFDQRSRIVPSFIKEVSRSVAP
jgi:hypothetical protein